MKKYLIVLFLISAQIGAFYLKAHSQRMTVIKQGNIELAGPDSAYRPNFIKTTLADETTLSYADKYAKIECDNDSVFMKLFTTHYQIITRFSASWKYDRHGRYKHYTIYLNKEDAELIKSWAKNNL